ncbi:hypothetical protein BDV96DRAFT_602277 [Lophiotrema nucula]|uniref:Uncharacterized protein n=1 Tax=Lophiotrema nucula TaxID=690887 RepID=A0A6A5Z1Z2_9PLEO|nr:hypothetical protein BDV96DRAFT_602277 [Lophiotrema nucula]
MFGLGRNRRYSSTVQQEHQASQSYLSTGRKLSHPRCESYTRPDPPHSVAYSTLNLISLPLSYVPGSNAASRAGKLPLHGPSSRPNSYSRALMRVLMAGILLSAVRTPRSSELAPTRRSHRVTQYPRIEQNLTLKYSKEHLGLNRVRSRGTQRQNCWTAQGVGLKRQRAKAKAKAQAKENLDQRNSAYPRRVVSMWALDIRLLRPGRSSAQPRRQGLVAQVAAASRPAVRRRYDSAGLKLLTQYEATQYNLVSKDRNSSGDYEKGYPPRAAAASRPAVRQGQARELRAWVIQQRALS